MAVDKKIQQQSTSVKGDDLPYTSGGRDNHDMQSDAGAPDAEKMSLEQVLASIRLAIMDGELPKSTQSPTPPEKTRRQASHDAILRTLYSKDTQGQYDKSHRQDTLNPMAKHHMSTAAEKDASKTSTQHTDSGARETTVQGEQQKNTIRFKQHPPLHRREGQETTKNLPDNKVKPFVLTNVVKVGTDSTRLLSKDTQRQIERHLQDIMDVYTAVGHRLPPSFFERENVFLKTWLNQYLPGIVERQVQEEIRRISAYLCNKKRAN